MILGEALSISEKVTFGVKLPALESPFCPLNLYVLGQVTYIASLFQFSYLLKEEDNSTDFVGVLSDG